MWLSKRLKQLLSTINRLHFYIRVRKLEAQCSSVQSLTFAILHFVIWREIPWLTIQMNYALNGKYSQADNHPLWIYFHLWGCSATTKLPGYSLGTFHQPLSSPVCPFQHNTLCRQQKLIPVRLKQYKLGNLLLFSIFTILFPGLTWHDTHSC
jgi:hypothetical protein